MARKLAASAGNKTQNDYLNGKSPHTVDLFHHFIHEYKQIGEITVHPAKTMIGIATSRKRIAYITQLGKDYIHVVFMFQKPYLDNLCFDKVVKVPGTESQFNHHFRMFSIGDLNKEVREFMRLAYQLGE